MLRPLELFATLLTVQFGRQINNVITRRLILNIFIKKLSVLSGNLPEIIKDILIIRNTPGRF
jgi:hypothetical protein